MKTPLLTALAIVTLSSATFAQSARFNIATLKVEKSALASALIAKEIGIKISEKCAAISPSDSLLINTIDGRAGREDFTFTATRTGTDGSSKAISGSVDQNLDVNFAREYTIQCDQRANPMVDQSTIELDQIQYSKGSIDKSPVLTSAALDHVLVTSKGSDGSIIITETQALVVKYKNHMSDGSINPYEHSFGLQLNQMSPQFIEAAGRAQVNAAEMVVVVINKVTKVSDTQVCAEKTTVNQGPQYPGDDGGPVQVCARYENQQLIQQLEGFRLAPRF